MAVRIRAGRFHCIFIFFLLASCLLYSQEQKKDAGEIGASEMPSIELLPAGKALHVSQVQYGAPSTQVAQFLGMDEARIRLGTLFTVVSLEWGTMELLLGTGGSVTSDLQYRTRNNLLNADYYVDFIVAELKFRDQWSFRFGPSHTSHHFSDIGFAERDLTTPFQYSRDYLHAGIHWKPDPAGSHMYVTALYNYAFIAGHRNHDPWMFSLGGELLTGKMMGNVQFSITADWTIIADLGGAASQTYEAGALYQNPGGRTLGLALQYHAGLDDRGQFYGVRTKQALLILRIR